jgi:hypothetical protein
MIGFKKDCLWLGGDRQDQQQQQQGSLKMEEEGNRWKKDLVMLMSTIMIDKDRVG